MSKFSRIVHLACFSCGIEMKEDAKKFGARSFRNASKWRESNDWVGRLRWFQNYESDSDFCVNFNKSLKALFANENVNSDRFQLQHFQLAHTVCLTEKVRRMSSPFQFWKKCARSDSRRNRQQKKSKSYVGNCFLIGWILKGVEF